MTFYGGSGRPVDGPFLFPEGLTDVEISFGVRCKKGSNSAGSHLSNVSVEAYACLSLA